MAIKLFISQPMRDLTKEEIFKQREDAVVRIKAKLGDSDIEVIDTYIDDNKPRKPLNYLADSLHMLADADVAYFIGDWKQFKGCMIEHICAEEYGIKVVIED